MYLNSNRVYITIITAFLLMGIFSSCASLLHTKVVNPPAGKPFVYSNKINLSGNLSKDEKKRMTYELENYWEDSLQVREVQSWIIKTQIRNPPVFDSANIQRSISFMNAYLNAQGYFYAHLKDSVYIDTIGDQLRANVIMNIDIGKNITIDTVTYNLSDSTLQSISLAKKEESELVKGKPYTKQRVSTELDRLTSLYREKGYYNFTREDLQAILDTVDTRLLALTLDPFKQAELVAEADRKRKENPSWKIELRTKPNIDSAKLRQYYIGQIYYYPETSIYDVPDSLIKVNNLRTDTFRTGIMKYRKGLFRYRALREATELERGTLYNEKDYFKTLNRFSQLPAWQQVDAINVVRNRDSLDIHLFLVPATKQSVSIDLEGSRNSGDVITGNTLGISSNLTLANRNLWRQAIQSQSTIRAGVELNLLNQNDNPLLQTYILNASHTYIIPRILHPFGRRWRALRDLDNKRTLISLNSSFVDRRGFYKINNYVGSIGYEWRKPKRNGDNLWLYKPLNIEIYGITRLPGLELLIKDNPFLQASFNEGNVVSQSLTFIRTSVNPNNRNKSNFYRLSLEEAGGLFGLLPGLRNNIYRYIKTEAEYKHRSVFLKTELAYRAFLGIGYNYGDGAAVGRSMPFFKQFIAGGPYSMRAWSLRQLGLGSSQFSDTVNSTYRDRFGDMQLETNIEYRFQLATIGSFKIGSAVFADIGNIWNLRSNSQDPDSRFSLRNLYRDLAVGVGTGLRFDFDYFLIRFDLAYKVKDPARNRDGGWMSLKDFVWSETRSSGLKVSNMALQFGIGLPF
jgi:hypothetical protein